MNFVIDANTTIIADNDVEKEAAAIIKESLDGVTGFDIARSEAEVKVGDIVEIKFGDKISKFEIINIPKVQTKDMPEMIKLL